MIISIGFLVAYDYGFLEQSLPYVYGHTDHIILCMDKSRLSLTGQPYFFDEGFKDQIRQFDTDRKIIWLEKDFYAAGSSPQQVVMRMRNEMLRCMPPSDWYIQLDTDEYFLDFGGFRQWLEQTGKRPVPTMVQVAWKTMFKQLGKGFLMIGGRKESIGVAINIPVNTGERQHEQAAREEAPFTLLHQSWARGEREIRQKIANWSHARDFDGEAFFRTWQQCGSGNYRFYRNFHPIHGPNWEYLEWVEAAGINELLSHYRVHPPRYEPAPPLPLWFRMKKFVQKMLA